LAREKKAFTDTFLKTVKDQPKRQEIYDDRGLGVWVQATGKRLVGRPTITFFYRYTSPTTKKREYLTIGRYGDEGIGTTLKEARIKREEFEALVAHGYDPKTHSSHAIGTLEELTKIFFEKKVIGLAFQTQKTYKSALNSKIIPAFGKKRITQIKRDDIIRLLDRVYSTAGYEMMKQTKKVLSSLYSFALDQYGVPGLESNIAASIKLKPWKAIEDKKQKPEKRWLRLEEIKKFWNHLEAHEGFINDSYIRLWRLILITGCRPIEAVGMKWSDIGSHVLVDVQNLEAIDTSRLWLRPGSLMKNGKPHLIYLTDLAMEVIEPRKGEQGKFVLWTTDELSEKQMISRRKYSEELLKMSHGEYNQHEAKDKRRALPVIGLPKFVQNDLRRTVATQMGNLSINPIDISRVLSHSGDDGGAQVTREHYNLADYINEKIEALTRWENKLREVLFT